ARRLLQLGTDEGSVRGRAAQLRAPAFDRGLGGPCAALEDHGERHAGQGLVRGDVNRTTTFAAHGTGASRFARRSRVGDRAFRLLAVAFGVALVGILGLILGVLATGGA